MTKKGHLNNSKSATIACENFGKNLNIAKTIHQTFFLLRYLDDFFLHEYHGRLPNLIEFQNQIDIDKLVIPDDRLHITKVNIQSPGYWEFLGNINPLEKIRKYLNDRHEREKDRKYRNRQEQEKGDLEIVDKKIELLKKMGYSETEIRQLATTMVTNPLRQLDQYQDNGQIDEPEE